MTRKLLAALLSLACCAAASCATTGRDTAGSEGPVLAAEASEQAVRASCPRNMVELALLTGIRLGFDAASQGRLSGGQSRRVAAARAATNQACGLIETTVAEEAPAPPAPLAI